MTESGLMTRSGTGHPEREGVPEYRRGTEQPFMGMTRLLAPLANGIRAKVWTITPP